MRRWNLPVLMTVLVAVVLALSGAKGTPSPSMTFKGKPAVYYRTSSAYFVINLNCMGGSLNGSNWTWQPSSGPSFSGTLALAPNAALPCELNGPPWSSGTSLDGLILTPQTSVNTTTATLNLVLSDISKTQTFVKNTTTCPSGSACIQIDTFGLGSKVGSTSDTDFHSVSASGNPYATLTLSVR
jgi:hypothetical protein